MTKDTQLSDLRLRLSPREAEVLKWTACGKTSGEIAKLLAISIDTVNAHIKNVCSKLNASNKAHATAIAITHGVIQSAPSPELVIPLTMLLGLSKYPVTIPLSQPSRRIPKTARQA